MQRCNAKVPVTTLDSNVSRENSRVISIWETYVAGVTLMLKQEKNSLHMRCWDEQIYICTLTVHLPVQSSCEIQIRPEKRADNISHNLLSIMARRYRRFSHCSLLFLRGIVLYNRLQVCRLRVWCVSRISFLCLAVCFVPGKYVLYLRAARYVY